MFNRDQLLTSIRTNQLQHLDLSNQSIAAPSCVGNLNDQGGEVYALVVLPDDRLASGSSTNGVKLWDIKTQRCLTTFADIGDLNTLVVLPDGQLASGQSARRTLDGKAESGDLSTLVLPPVVPVPGQSAGWTPGSGKIYIWDMKTLQPVIVLAEGYSVCTLALLPDGQLASGQQDGKTIKLWNIKTRQHLVVDLTGHSDGVHALAVLPDGRLASGSMDKTIRIWDVKTQQCLAILTGHSDGVRTLAVLPDGQLASGSDDNTIRIWDIKTQQCLATLTGHSGVVKALAVLPNGRLASGSYDKTIKIWNIKTQKCLATVRGHSGHIHSLAVLPDGRLASGSADKAIKFWNIYNKRSLSLNDITPLLKALETNISVQTITLQKTLLQDGDLLKFTRLLQTNTTITEIDLRETAVSIIGINTLTAHLKTRPTPLKLQHNNRVINLPAAITRSSPMTSPPPVPPRPKLVKFFNDDKNENVDMFNRDQLLTNILTNQLQQLNLSKQRIAEISYVEIEAGIPWGQYTHDRMALASCGAKTLAVLPDGRLASGTDKGIKLWDIKTKQCLATFAEGSYVYNLAVLPDGRLASASSKDKGVRHTQIDIWDTKTQQCVMTLAEEEGDRLSLALLPDGQLASLHDNYGTKISIWDTNTQQCVAVLTNSATNRASVGFVLAVLPNGWLASRSTNNTIKLSDIKTQQCLATLTGHSREVINVALLPDGQLASASWDNTIKIWDIKTQQCLATLESGGTVYGLVMLPDGRLASRVTTPRKMEGSTSSYGASGSREHVDETIKLWNIKTQECLATRSAYGISALAVLPDGRLVCGSGNGKIELWDFDSKRPLSLYDITPLLKALETNRSVQTISVQNTLLQDANLSSIAHLLETNTTITELDLRDTAVSVNGINTLTDRLQTRPTALKLQHNDAVDGVINLPAAIKQSFPIFNRDELVTIIHTNELQQLNLSDQWIAEPSCVDIATACNETPLETNVNAIHGGLYSPMPRNEIYNPRVLALSRNETPIEVNVTEHVVRALALLPNTRLVTGSQDGIKLWDISAVVHYNIPYPLYQSGGGHIAQGDPPQNAHAVHALAVLPDNLLASGSQNEIKLWDIKTQRCLAIFAESDIDIRNMESTETQRHIGLSRVSRSQPSATAYRQPRPSLRHSSGIAITQRATIFAESYSVYTLVLLPNGQLASGHGNGNTIKLWNTETQQCVAALTGHTDSVCALAVLPDGRLASGSYDSTIKIWDIKTQQCVATLMEHSDKVRTLAVLPDGQLASGSDDNTIKLWDIKTQQCLATLTHSGGVCALAVLPDGRLVSGSENKKIKLWNTKTQKCLATFKINGGHIHSLAVLPDGRLVSGSEDKTIRFWDLDNKRHLSLNEITPLLEALETNTSVQTINLQKTLLQDVDLPKFTHLLQTNTTITELDFRETAVSVNGINTLTAQLQTRPTALKLQYNAGVIDSLAAITKSFPNALHPPVQPPQQGVDWSVSYQIAYSELTIGEELGRGGFGIVYQGTWRFYPVAIKQLLVEPSADDLAGFTAEAKIMAQLPCPNIVQFYGICLGNPKYCIVMEYMPKGSLCHVLHSKETLSPETRYKIVCDIARGLAFLHAQNILHRDLKSLNVLLDEHMRAKLSDFGLAKIKKEISTASISAERAGSIQWWAPELFKPEGKCTKKSDIYSLGLTIWEVYSRRIPFKDVANPALIPTLVEKVPADCPQKLSSLIKSCWARNSQSRPSAADVVKYLTSDAKDMSELESKPTYIDNFDSERKHRQKI